jgi:hypothetical protein
MDSIRVRDLLNRAQAHLALLAQLPEATDAGIFYRSFLWRQKLFSLPDEAQRVRYTTQIVDDRSQASLQVSTQVIKELANPSSELRTAGDLAAHPSNQMTALGFDALIDRADERTKPFLRGLVAFSCQS